MIRRLSLALLAGAALAGPVRAQLADTKVLSSEGAKVALAAAEAEARKNGWALSIAVVDAHGELLAFTRMDGASLLSIGISQGKARTSARTKRATKEYADRITSGNNATLALDVMPLEGGVPIVVNGVVVGAIGASGAASPQDAQASMAGAAAVKP